MNNAHWLYSIMFALNKKAHANQYSQAWCAMQAYYKPKGIIVPDAFN